MESVDVLLQKSHLTTIEHIALQRKVLADSKRKISSRRSIHKGGLSATIDELREQQKNRDERDRGTPKGKEEAYPTT
jgi:hypothetical protein